MMETSTRCSVVEQDGHWCPAINDACMTVRAESALGLGTLISRNLRTMVAPLRILVVDDSLLYRKVVRDVLASLPEIEVVGTASDGPSAVDRIKSLKPDLVTLDVEMPAFDGLEVLKQLKQSSLPTGVLMLSSLSDSAASLTTRALSLGAFDFILKPQESSHEQSTQRLREELAPRIEAFRTSWNSSRVCLTPTPSPTKLEGKLTNGNTSENSANAVSTSSLTSAGLADQIKAMLKPRAIKLVVVGVSTGGPATLQQLIPKLPADFPVPIVIVQHMPPVFTKNLANDLNRESTLDVAEATHGELLKRGMVRIAPGGKQLRLQADGFSAKLQVTDDPPVKMCRPSVDYLFESAATHFGSQVLGVILTGMGDDGLDGCRRLRQEGATIVAQSEDGCVVFGMPKQIIVNKLADIVCPITQMAALFNDFAFGKQRS